MHRFYLPSNECSGPSLTLRAREAHHALHVLRLRDGDSLEILDGEGTRYRCRIIRREKRELQLSLEEKVSCPAPAWRITLLPAVAKPKALEWIVQKSVELGVSGLVPIITERVSVKAGPDRFNLDKWRWVAIDAMKQCGSPWLPSLETPAPLPRFLERETPFDLIWVASLSSDRHPRDTIESFRQKHGRPPRHVAVWIGPEGDFTEREMKDILDSGAQAVSLGPRVLRAETAAVYCLSVLNHELRYMEQAS